MQESLRLRLPRRLNVALACLVTLACGAAAAWLAGDFIDGRIRRDMLRRAPVAGLVLTADLDPAELMASTSDLAKPVHRQFRERARRLMLLNPSLRAISLLRVPSRGGATVYVFDFREHGYDEEALPGDAFVPRYRLNGLERLMREGDPVLSGPFDAGAGPRGMAYAFIPDPETGAPRDFRHVVRIEADAAEWRQSVLLGQLLAGLGVCGLVGVPLAMLLLGDRQRLQSNVIRDLSEAVEHAHSAILILDPAGRIEFCNDVGSRLLGLPRDRLAGRDLRDFLRVAGGDARDSGIDASFTGGEAWQGEASCLRAAGDAFPVRGGLSPVRNRDGRIVSFVAVFDDISELRRREDELREATEQAQAADRAKGEFLATMSHEVRTPLNAVVGFAGLLLESSPLNETQRDQLLAIRASADSLVRLTSDILDFARIEAGTARIDPAPCDPRECVEEAVDLHAAAAAQKGLEIFHRVSPGVPASIITDEGRLRQVLVNLVGNAVKFTEQGEIEVLVSLPPERPGGGGLRLEFAVRDTGPGIAAEDQPRLFRPFTQLEATSLRRHGGAGLGLAISRNLLEMLGGDIRVESRPGDGATFRFSIPARVELPARGPAAPGARLGLVAPAGRFREALAELMRSWGAVVLEADTPGRLPAAEMTLVVRDLDEAGARRLVSAGDSSREPGEENTIALVPLSLAPETRADLRGRFRALVTKPVRSRALLPLIAGSAPASPAAAARSEFGFHVLVAEDNPVNQRLIRLMLENLGCTAKVVADGRALLAALARAPRDHDLVVLDMHMPELDGLDVLRAIRAGEAGGDAREIRVVALSADVRNEQRAAAAAAGVDEYMTKPVTLGAMEEMLLRLRASRTRRADPVG